MLVFSFLQNAAKVQRLSMLRGKCVQKRAFVAKFGYLWRKSGIFGVKFGGIQDSRFKIQRFKDSKFKDLRLLAR